MFLPNRAKAPQYKHIQPITLAGKSGLNYKDLAEFMNPAFALINENFFVQNNRGLSKRGGIIKIKEIVGNKAITMIEEWKGYFIFGYDKTVAALNRTTGVVTNIKTDWATSDKFSGAPYGDYFFVGNKGNKINYVTESAGVFTVTEITAAPMSSIIKAIGPRLYAANGSTVYYCDIDTGANPPFVNWSVAETATSGGKVSFRNAGDINAICSLGDIIVCFGAAGKFAFRLQTQSDGTGVVVKIEEVIIDRVDMGGASGAITTPKGLFYVNTAGLWQIISLGQPNIAFSDQETLTSVNLGTEFFKDVRLDNCDITYYGRYNTVLVTCAKQSVQNNLVIAYNPEIQAFSTFKNWNIGRWLSYQNEIYAGSSIKTAIYHCFAGNSDDGSAITATYQQELKCGNLWSRQMLYGGYVKGLLTPLSLVKLSFDIYDITGKLQENKISFNWTPQTNTNKVDGWGTASWGTSAYGGDVDNSGMIECFDGFHQFIRNFQRIRVNVTESSLFPFQLDWLSLDARSKADIRRRKLTLNN